MAGFELFFRLEGSEYGDGVMMEEYNGKIAFVSANESQNGGTVYRRWAFPQDRDKKPRAKAIPLGVRLGNRTQAIGILRAALAALDKSVEPVRNDPVPSMVHNDEQIPF